MYNVFQSIISIMSEDMCTRIVYLALSQKRRNMFYVFILFIGVIIWLNMVKCN